MHKISTIAIAAALGLAWTAFPAGAAEDLPHQGMRIVAGSLAGLGEPQSDFRQELVTVERTPGCHDSIRVALFGRVRNSASVARVSASGPKANQRAVQAAKFEFLRSGSPRVTLFETERG